MMTKLPWAESLTYRPNQFAKMLSIADSYVGKLEEKSGIKAKRIGDSIARLFTVEDVFAAARWRQQNGSVASPARQIITSVYLPKGGVGKTTTAIEVSTQLALRGFKTLVIDLDPQGDLSQGMGYDPEMQEQHAAELGLPEEMIVQNSFANLFDIPRFYEPVQADQVIKKPFGEFGPHVIPADMFLLDFEDVINIQPNREKLISTLMQKAKSGQLKNFDTSEYDFIVFDCAPGNSVLTKNALLASDYVIAPVALSMFSTKGLSRFSRALLSLQETFGVAPQPFIVPTMFELNVNRIGDNITILKQNFANAICNVVVRKTEDFSTALNHRLPLSLHKPKSAAAGDYRDMTREFVDMITAQTALKQGELEV